MSKRRLSVLLMVLALLAAFIYLFNLPVRPPISQPNAVVIQTTTFASLPGFNQANLVASFNAFKASCRVFLHSNPQQSVGTELIALKAQDWYPSCHAALALTQVSKRTTRVFFQTWFKPVEFAQGDPLIGLFTGYYLPMLSGSLTQSNDYPVPVYGTPRDLLTLSLRDFDVNLPSRTLVAREKAGHLLPYYSRQAINDGRIASQAPVLVWLKNAVDRLFLEIQGSGRVELTDGNTLFLGYASENGLPYTPIARILIERGVMTKDNASMQGIRAYLEAHPDEMDEVINHNQSMVFFRKIEHTGALGAQGIVLTPGYSLAVDKRWVPLGTPIWLSTTRPDAHDASTHPFLRLMIAQDTGGAIRGPVRGDVFWGSGDAATSIAGKMKNNGRYWLLLPK